MTHLEPVGPVAASPADGLEGGRGVRGPGYPPSRVAPPITAPGWVTVDELVAMLGLKTPAQLDAAAVAVATANQAVANRLNPDTDDTGTPVWPAGIVDSAPLHTAALTLAVDAYRRPMAPAGVFRVDDFYARLPANIYVAVDSLIAASGYDLEGGFA